MIGDKDEFYAGLIIGGGIALVCLLVLIALTFVAMGIRNKVKKNEIINQIKNEQRNRTNGRH